MIYPEVENAAPMEMIEGRDVVRVYRALEKVSGNPNKLDNEHKELLTYVFSEKRFPILYQTGIHRTSGYIVDFRPWLRLFWVKTKYFGIREYAAFNRTMIRTLASTPSAILKIVEVD